MSERREPGIPPSSKRGHPARRQETKAEPTGWEAEPRVDPSERRQEGKP